MRLPTIDNLDLRPYIVIGREALAKLDDDWRRTITWDWPEFPPRVAEFIETGRVPMHSVRAHNAAHRLIYGMMATEWFARYLGMADLMRTPTKQGR